MKTKIFPDDLVGTDTIRARMDDLELDHIDDEGETIDVGLWDEADRREYRALAEVLEEVCGDQRDSVTLIHENYFEQYLRADCIDSYAGEYGVYVGEGYRDGHFRGGDYEMISMSDLLARRPFSHIDWKALAANSWADYQQVEIDGVTYLYEEA